MPDYFKGGDYIKKKILNLYKRMNLDTSELEQMIQAQEIQNTKEKEEIHKKNKRIKEIEKLEKKTSLDLSDVKSKIRRGNWQFAHNAGAL